MASTKERAWLAAHQKGSKALIKKLDKAHANNPEYQAFKKKHGLGDTSSVKQVSKSQVDAKKEKARQALAAKAYGATRGTRMGGEDGRGEEIRDTTVPLSPEQHSKVKAAERAAKPVKEKKPRAKKAPTENKPVDRMALLKQIASKKKINNPPVSHKQLRTIAAVGGQEHDHGGWDDLAGTGFEGRSGRNIDEEVETFKVGDKVKVHTPDDLDWHERKGELVSTSDNGHVVKLSGGATLSVSKHQIKKIDEEVEQINEVKMGIGTVVKLKKPIDGHSYATVKGFTSSGSTRGPTGRGVPMPTGNVKKVKVALRKSDDHSYYPGPVVNIHHDDVHSVIRESYEKAEMHKDKASKALETSDMEAYHQHMANHHEELGKWHESKGRGDVAQKHFDKAEQHHEKSIKPASTLKGNWKMKNEGILSKLLGKKPQAKPKTTPAQKSTGYQGLPAEWSQEKRGNEYDANKQMEEYKEPFEGGKTPSKNKGVVVGKRRPEGMSRVAHLARLALKKKAMKEGYMKRTVDREDEEDDGGMNEYERDASETMSDKMKKQNITGKDKATLAKIHALMKSQKKPVKEETRLPPKFYAKVVAKLNKKKAGVKEEAKRQVEPPPSAMPSDTRLNPLPKAKKGVRIGSTNKFGHYTPGMKEEVEQIAEVGDTPKGKATLASYVKKAAPQIRSNTTLKKDFEDEKYRYLKIALKHSPNVDPHKTHERDPEKRANAEYLGKGASDLSDKFGLKAKNRIKGIQRAATRLAKEEVDQTDEAVRIYDRIRSKIDPQHGEKGTFQGEMERLHMAAAARDRRKITKGYGVKGFNSAMLKPKTGSLDTNLVRAKKTNEDVEQVDEVLKPSMGASAYISDFVHSKNPKFAGKSKAERTKMALGAYYGAKKAMKEGLDPVGKEDADVNNDGKHGHSTDKYLLKRRAAISKAIASKKG